MSISRNHLCLATIVKACDYMVCYTTVCYFSSIAVHHTSTGLSLDWNLFSALVLYLPNNQGMIFIYNYSFQLSVIVFGSIAFTKHSKHPPFQKRITPSILYILFTVHSKHRPKLESNHLDLRYQPKCEWNHRRYRPWVDLPCACWHASWRHKR